MKKTNVKNKTSGTMAGYYTRHMHWRVCTENNTEDKNDTTFYENILNILLHLQTNLYKLKLYSHANYLESKLSLNVGKSA